MSEDPNQGHRTPRGRTVCFVETAESMGGPSGPCQRYSLPLRQGSLPCEERWHLLAEDGTSEVADVSAPVTPMSSELTRIEVSESRRDQIRRGWATRQRVHVEGEASQFRWLRAPATMNDEGRADAAAANPFRLPRLYPGIGSPGPMSQAWSPWRPPRSVNDTRPVAPR